MSEKITVTAVFESIDRAEKTARLIKKQCAADHICLSHMSGTREAHLSMGSLLLDYGFSQTDPRGPTFNMPSYPPYWFTGEWISESEEKRRWDVFPKEQCRLTVTADSGAAERIRRILINGWGENVTIS